MLDNLNSKFESSRVQALDVNDDEVELFMKVFLNNLKTKQENIYIIVQQLMILSIMKK